MIQYKHAPEALQDLAPDEVKNPEDNNEMTASDRE